MLMRAATVVQQLCKSCRTCFKFYCVLYFTCDHSFTHTRFRTTRTILKQARGRVRAVCPSLGLVRKSASRKPRYVSIRQVSQTSTILKQTRWCTAIQWILYRIGVMWSRRGASPGVTSHRRSVFYCLSSDYPLSSAATRGLYFTAENVTITKLITIAAMRKIEFVETHMTRRQRNGID